MRRTIIAATALLVVQAVLAVALNFSGAEHREVSPASSLFAFKPDAVTALEITGPAAEHLVIRKAGSGWTLPDDLGAPASSEQVHALLEKLAELKQGFVVATSDEAARRFKVADTAYERHVVVKEGDKVVGDLFVGTSPGFRQVHARKAGTPDIVNVALATFELETAPDKWLDKYLYRLKKEDMQSVSYPDFTLNRKNDSWQVADLESGKIADKDAVDDVVNGISGLTIQDVLKPQDVEPLFARPVLAFTVNLKDGKKLEYSFAKPDADYYVVKRSDNGLYGKVHSIQFENLHKYTREKMVKKVEAPAVGKDGKEVSQTGGTTPAEVAKAPAAGAQ